jgi:uncharacterized protein YpmB
MKSQLIKYIVVAILGVVIGAASMRFTHSCEAPVINSEYDARDSIIARGDEMIASLLEQLEERDTVYVAVVAKEKKERKKINSILRDDFSLANDSVKKSMIDEALKNINIKQ